MADIIRVMDHIIIFREAQRKQFIPVGQIIRRVIHQVASALTTYSKRSFRYQRKY